MDKTEFEEILRRLEVLIQHAEKGLQNLESPKVKRAFFEVCFRLPEPVFQDLFSKGNWAIISLPRGASAVTDCLDETLPVEGVISINEPEFEKLKTNEALEVMAEELAHAYKRHGRHSEKREEQEAKALIKTWGFSSD